MGSPLTPSSTRPAIPRRTGRPCVSALQRPALARQLGPCPRRLRAGTTAPGGSNSRPSQRQTGSGRFCAPVGADYCPSAEHRHPEHRSRRPCPFRRLLAPVPGMRSRLGGTPAGSARLSAIWHQTKRLCDLPTAWISCTKRFHFATSASNSANRASCSVACSLPSSRLRMLVVRVAIASRRASL